jgi:urate oxidase
MAVILSHNNYGKSQVRLVRVARHRERHDLQELTVNLAVEGDFEAAHTSGDNASILPTDTMKNTVYALAGQSSAIEEIESFGLRLAEHFLGRHPQISGIIVEIAENQWARIPVGGKLHQHSFTAAGGEKRLTTITATRDDVVVESGVEDLVVLKTTMSGFFSFLKDEYTTLRETAERIFATSIKSTWVYSRSEAASAVIWHGARQLILETFAQHDSLSVQHTLYAIGQAVLDNYEEITEISLSMPNRHCLLVDLSPFGMDNNNEIFVPTSEPYGLIEARLVKS